MNHLFIIFICAFSILTIGTTSSQAQQTTKAKQAYVVDYTTGQVLLDKNSKEKMPTSSMSKVVTSYMVFDALKSGRIQMGTKFNVSKKAWKKGGSKMFVKVDTKVTVEDLLRGVIVQSGNDATIVLAEGLEGSEDAFAKKMTRKALEIGMEDSNFMNASGWPDPKHYSTARDLVVMTRAIIEDFPEYYTMFGEKEFTYSNIKQANRNPLLYLDIGADGLKTGHTEIAGYGLIGTAKKDDRRVVMVVNGLDSEADRKSESARLIKWALQNFKNEQILNQGQEITQAPVKMGVVDNVLLSVNDDILLTVPDTGDKVYKLSAKYNSPLIAPLKAGDEIGKLVISIPNIEAVEYPLYVAQDVPKLGFFMTIIEKIKHFIAGKL